MKQPMRQVSILFFLFSLFFVNFVYASGSSSGSGSGSGAPAGSGSKLGSKFKQVGSSGSSSSSVCDEALKGPGSITILGSGRDSKELPTYEEAAKHLSEVAFSLGYKVPRHIISFVPAGEMNMLSSLGHHPAHHWYHGYQIARNKSSSGNILEFMTRACESCRSYFSDFNGEREQISIIAHVIGHNHVSEVSNYHRAVHTDSMGYSKAFAQKVQWLYENYDHDEVSLFVQWLFSLDYMQDLVMGSYDSPEFFKPNPNVWPQQEKDSPLTRQELVYKNYKNPPRPSANILQALVYNLPASAPDWKKDLVKIYEQSKRFISGNVSTKILNEGFATLSQYLIIRHSKYVTDLDLSEFGGLLYGVKHPDLKNPYYLGLEAWMNIWEKFKKNHQGKGLSHFEIDKLFVEYANELITKHDDYSFLDLALDQDWIDKNKFVLVRAVTETDPVDISKAPQQPEGADELLVVLSRHKERIVRQIQRKTAAKHFYFPQVKITDFNWNGLGIVHFYHEMYEGIPLKFSSSVLSLFVLSQILEKPVALTYSDLVTLQSNQGSYQQRGVTQLKKFHLLIYPTGKVEGYFDSEDSKDPFKNKIPQITEMADPIIKAYKESIQGTLNEEFYSSRLDPIWKNTINGIVDSNLESVSGVVSHAPTLGGAIWEYHKFIEEVFQKAIKKLISSGKMPSIQNGKVSINIFPPVPSFELDPSRQWKEEMPPPPIDKGLYNPAPLVSPDQDDGAILGAALQLPGDLFWGKNPKQGQGQGQGQGKKGQSKDEGEDGEESPGNGNQAGQGGGQVLVPQEFWGKILGDILKLTNLRRTKGDSEENKKVRRGSAKRPSGYFLDDLTVINAIEKALAIRKLSGLPYEINKISRSDLIREAIKLMDAGDIVVADYMSYPKPDHEAVLVVAGDMTGSMEGQRIKIAKQLIYNIQALLKANYKKITIRYVAFAGDAEEVKEEVFFKNFKGGGTSYVAGLTKSKEILDEYSNATHNKYILLVGDAESSDGVESQNIIRSLYEDLQFFSMAATVPTSFSDTFINQMKSLKSEWPYIGISRLNSEDDIIPSLKELYPEEVEQR